MSVMKVKSTAWWLWSVILYCIFEGRWHCTADRDQDIPMEKKCKKAKWLSGEALQIAVKRREIKSKGEKERYKHLNAKFQRIARRDKKASSAINAKK